MTGLLTLHIQTVLLEYLVLKKDFSNLVQHFSDHMPEIYGTYLLKMHCSLINTNIEDDRRNSNVIYSCPVDHHKIGANVVDQPANIAFYPMNTTRIYNVRITVTNQDDEKFDHQGERLLMSFICKPA